MCYLNNVSQECLILFFVVDQVLEYFFTGYIKAERLQCIQLYMVKMRS